MLTVHPPAAHRSAFPLQHNVQASVGPAPPSLGQFATRTRRFVAAANCNYRHTVKTSMVFALTGGLA